jgi:exonuclease SbcC
MRPISLHIEGFGVFRDPIEIDFDGVDYFALVGPTGSGKSTVMDAICFALYGSVPRYGDERLVGRAVSTGKQEAKVSLTFTIGEAKYRATRVVRVRDGKTSTPEALLERIDSGSGLESELLASKVREMRPAVEQLLGLPFQHFIKCVLLPQGEFARFLHDDPARRQDLLSRLLDLDVYERIGQRARQKAAAAEAAAALHGNQLGELAFATPEARDAAQQRREALRGLYDALEVAAPKDDELARASAGARATAEKATAMARALAAVAVPNDLETHAARLAVALEERHASADALRQAQAELDEATKRSAATPDPIALTRIADAYAQIATLQEQSAGIVAELESAARASADASAAVDAAEHAHDTARDAHAAHAVAATLVAGEQCPVCRQTVTSLPKRGRVPALQSAEKAVTSARAAATKAAAAEAKAAARAQQTVDQLGTLAAVVDGAPTPHEVEQLLGTAQELSRALAGSQTRVQTARTADANASEALQQAEELAAHAQRALTTTRDALLRLDLDVPEPGDDLAGAWESLMRWSATTRSEKEAVARGATALAERLDEMRRDAFADLVERASEFGLTTTVRDLFELRELVVEHGTEARNALARIDEAIDAAEKLREARSAAVAEQEVAELLARELRADRFEKWLLTEALEVLVASASQTLYSLSGGEYSLRYSAEGEFVVVDHRDADMTRSAKTLSGGETFQASLALALALSDQLASLSASGGAKLDAIFLDEGFGTLDADTLDTVATTIEALGTTGRMVGVVTHVPALAERVPVRYRVQRTDRCATVTREDA